MRSRWVVVVCALVAISALVGCAAGQRGEVYTAAVDKMVVLDAAAVAAGPDCGQRFPHKLKISSDDLPGNSEPRHVIFMLQNAGGEDRVVIRTKAASDNPAGWKDIPLDANNTVQATPRVGKGQVKHESKWDYQIVFTVDRGKTCTIDPGVCIRTQTGGCEGYY